MHDITDIDLMYLLGVYLAYGIAFPSLVIYRDDGQQPRSHMLYELHLNMTYT